MCAKKDKADRYKEIRNRKVSHKFFVGDKYEAGIVLRGTEVKSVRNGKAQISESFARMSREDVILYQAHIDEYAFGNTSNHNPTRPRKLLLHKRQIRTLRAALEAGGQAIIPTRMYFKSGLVKVEIALCKTKKLFDKRETLKKKTALREAQRSIKRPPPQKSTPEK